VGIRTRLRPLERAAYFMARREKKIKNLMHGVNGAFGNAATRIERDMVSNGDVFGAHPDIDDLFARQARELDRTKRETLLHQIQKIASERVMFVPIWEFANLHGVGARVAEPGLGLIDYMPFSAPYEEVRLHKP
jgi:ABC-type transport system substrate-binding protein